jgi:ribokinase
MIAVIGSSNVDFVLNVTRFTSPGETQKCLHFDRYPGGKGANQAVTCSKLGSKTFFLTCLGDDENGKFMYEKLKKSGIKKGIHITESNNGLAIIEVSKSGENRIIIYSGANSKLTPNLILQEKQELLSADILLIQNEIDFAATFTAAKIFKENKKTVIFDPAPAENIDEEIYKYVDIITPNEDEAEKIIGMKLDSENAASELLKKCPENVLLKMGSKGIFFTGKMGTYKMHTFKVNVVDTTAAGDIFNAAFAVALDKNFSLKKALEFATASAALSVTKSGAQASVPTKDDVTSFLEKGG